MATTEGREPLRHIAWWWWFVPTAILAAILLYAVKTYKTPMERGVSAAPHPGVHLLA